MRSQSTNARIWARRKQELAAIAVITFIFFAAGYVGHLDHEDKEITTAAETLVYSNN